MSRTPGPYAPRDVVNAPALKTAIERRSLERGDPVDVRAWLLNHFYRHVVGNLQAPPPTVIPIESGTQWQRLLGTASLPDWATRRLAAASKTLSTRTALALHWIDPQSEAVLTLESRLLEFLGSRQGTPLAGKLMRVNCPQALALWAAEHAAFEARETAGWREHQAEAVQVIWEGPLGYFVEFIAHSTSLRAEMAYESQMMRHCLGQFSQRRELRGGYGERYAAACEAGELRLFSYRTRGGHQPHITVSAVVQPGAQLAIDQIKGKQNRPPVERYRGELLAFLNTLDTVQHIPSDAVAMGMARVAHGWQWVTQVHDPNEQLHLVQRHPAWIRELPQPLPLSVQWYAAACQPEQLAGLALSPSVARALSASQT